VTAIRDSTPQRDVFVLGAPRCGTSFLADCLAARPEVTLAEGKETHYLAAAALGDATAGPNGREFDRLRCRSRAEFDRRFSALAPVRLEASASSLYYAPAATAALRREFPDAVLLCVLRDPVVRALSSYAFMVGRGYESAATFEEGLAREADRERDGWNHMWAYVGAGHYRAQLDAWTAAGLSPTVLLMEHDLRTDELFTERLPQLLGLDGPVPGTGFRNAPDAGLQPGAARLVGRVRAWRAFRPVRAAVGAERLRRARAALGRLPLVGRRAGAEGADALSPALLADLRVRFRDDVEHVARLLGADVERLWPLAAG